MPFIEKIEARAYSRATEIPERVTNAILNIFPEDVRVNVTIEKESAEGQSGGKITIIAGHLNDSETCKTSFAYIFQHMQKTDLREVKRTLDLRLDDSCVFFLRIDKQGAYLGKIRLAENPDVIRVMIYFKDSPKCKQNDALLMVEEFLQNAED